jgi:hypothetical protein
MRSKVYRANWIDSIGTTYEIDIIPSLDESIAGYDVVNLSSKLYESTIVKIDRGDLWVGLGAVPIVELEMDTKYISSDLKDILLNSNADYAIQKTHTTPEYVLTYNGEALYPVWIKNIVAGNCFVFKVYGNVAFVGFQKSTVDGNYSDGILKIELWSVTKIVSEQLDLDCLKYLGLEETSYGNIKSTQNAYDYIFKTAESGLNTFAKVATSKQYYYFIKYERIFTYLSEVYKLIADTITRGYFDVSPFDNAIPFIDNITYYEQSYSADLSKGTALDYDDIYILMFITNKDLADRDVDGFFFAKTYYDVLENYKTLWDFLVAHSKSCLVRAYSAKFGFEYDKALEGAYINLDNSDREKSEINFDSGILWKSEAACVELNGSDKDKIEFILRGARTQRSDNLVVLFNTMVNGTRGFEQGGSYGTQTLFINRTKIVFDIDHVLFVRHSNPYLLKPYYFDTPNVSGDLTTGEVAIGCNHNITIDLGNSETFSDNILSNVNVVGLNFGTGLQTVEAAVIDTMNRSGGSLYHLARTFSRIYDGSQNMQSEIEIDVNLGNTYTNKSGIVVSGNILPLLEQNITKFVFDTSNITDFFENISDKHYLLSAEIDLKAQSETGYKPTAKIKLLSANYE